VTARSISLALLILGAPALIAQEPRGDLQVQVPGPVLSPGDYPTVRTRDVLNTPKIRDLMERGNFPAQLHFRLELWKKNRWFDEEMDFTEWTVRVAMAATTRRFTVSRVHDSRPETVGTYGTFEEAVAAVDRGYVVRQIARGESGREHYYSARLEVAVLQLSDLDALEAWLRGEVQPTLAGKRNPLTAVRRAVGTAFSRVIGGDRRSYEVRSGVFVVSG
jgi:hypothetical protein